MGKKIFWLGIVIAIMGVILIVLARLDQTLIPLLDDINKKFLMSFGVLGLIVAAIGVLTKDRNVRKDEPRII